MLMPWSHTCEYTKDFNVTDQVIPKIVQMNNNGSLVNVMTFSTKGHDCNTSFDEQEVPSKVKVVSSNPTPITPYYGIDCHSLFIYYMANQPAVPVSALVAFDQLKRKYCCKDKDGKQYENCDEKEE